MHKTPLHAWHVSHGAKMTGFGGWDMPLFYSAILEEHRTVREAVGLFDLSHMGRVRIRGPQAEALCQIVFTNDAGALEPGRACYGLICAPDGGAMDDVILYREPEAFLMIPNASNRGAVIEWLDQVRSEKRFAAAVEDVSDAIGMIGVQGPESASLLGKLSDPSLTETRRFAFLDAPIAGIPCRAARTGYTGEDGFELFCVAGKTEALWQAILDAGAGMGAKPCGLGSRDSLRIEAGLPLYGHELGRERNAALCGVERFIKWGKGEFIGKSALERAARDGSAPRLAGFELLERAVPRQGCALERDGRTVGETTSGLFSPTLNRGIGMGFIEPGCASPGADIAVRIRAKVFPARVVALPFYRRTGRSGAMKSATS